MAIGPGAVQEVTEDIKPTLDGASEYEYVTIHNPLSEDFAVRVAMDIPVNMPFNVGKDVTGQTAQTTTTERDVAQTYGLSLKNPDFVGRKHIYNDTIIPAGKTMTFKGNEAQVAVRQLVNEIMQREGNTKLQSDPTLRREVEERIIKSRGSVQDILDGNLQNPHQQINDAISNANEVNNGSEQAFPELTDAGNTDSSPEGTTAESEVSNPSSPRPVGRPKKADS